jgi:hypothetical protein
MSEKKDKKKKEPYEKPELKKEGDLKSITAVSSPD